MKDWSVAGHQPSTMVSELTLPKRFDGLASEPLISALLDEGDTSVTLPFQPTREEKSVEPAPEPTPQPKS